MSQGTRIRLARSHLPEFPGDTNTHVAARTSLLSIYWIRNLGTMARAYAKFGTLSNHNGDESDVALTMEGLGVAVSDADGQQRETVLLFGFGDHDVKVRQHFRH